MFLGQDRTGQEPISEVNACTIRISLISRLFVLDSNKISELKKE